MPSYEKKVYPVTWKRVGATPPSPTTYTFEIDIDPLLSPYVRSYSAPVTVTSSWTVYARWDNTDDDSSKLVNIIVDWVDAEILRIVTTDWIVFSQWSAVEMDYSHYDNMTSGVAIALSGDKYFMPTIVDLVTKDTKWPCPDWWHIGTQNEWTALYNTLHDLGVDTKTFCQSSLLMPSAYYLNRSNGSKNTSYWPVRYWTSTMTKNTESFCFAIDENDIVKVQADKPGNAFNIRPFKDTPVNSVSTWTILSSNTNCWVYYSSVRWLISWNYYWTWYTMTDKNLWATNVWDNWLYYQFWNNYWFSPSPSNYRTSKVTTDMTQYWPNNYYTDSKYTRVSSWNNWFTSTNNNIWWWVTNSESRLPIIY